MDANEWITVNRVLPGEDLVGTWGSIVAIDAVKGKLLNQALLAFRLRSVLPFNTTALHGLILLYGPPGTGKTTLARGVAQELCPFVGGHARLIEINPHGLMSPELGKSQQRVFELLCDVIPALSDDGMPTVVLLDEVESMAVARGEASLTVNPVDVHRATDAVLMAMDRNARNHPHIIFVATSNFLDALDDAFRSRADAAIEVPLATAEGVQTILKRALADFGEAFPQMTVIDQDPEFARLARDLVGFDGRRIRKIVTAALAVKRRTVMDPNTLETADLLDVVHRMRIDEEQTRRAA